MNRSPKHDLGPTAACIGRDAEVGAIQDLLEGTARLVSLVGPGGVGKTRLAEQMRQRLDDPDEYPGGVWFCDLARVIDEADTSAAIARGVGVQTRSGESFADALARNFTVRDRTLVILDNCDHVIGLVARIVSGWLAVSESVQFIVTTREPLAIREEQICTVGPLAPADAGRLFVDRARSADRGVTLDPNKVEHIVRALDCIPLAIEIVAARIGETSLDVLAQNVAAALDVQRTESSNTDRHHTMRSAIAWSCSRLSADEHAALCSLTALRGSFDARAALAVIGGPPDVSTEILRVLVSKSLVTQAPTQERRLRLHALVNAYASDAQRDADRAASLERHARHFAARSEEIRIGLESARAAAALRAFGLDYDNLLSAHTWLVEREEDDRALEMLANLGFAFMTVGPVRVRRDRLAAAAARGEHLSPKNKATLLLARAFASRQQGGRDDVSSLAKEALAIAEAADVQNIVASAHTALAERALTGGAYDEGLAHAQRGAAVARAAALPYYECAAIVLVAHAASELGRADVAEEALARGREVLGGATGWLVEPWLGIAECELFATTGNRDLVLRLRGIAALSEEIGDRRALGSASAFLAVAQIEQGDNEAAEDSIQRARRAFADIGHELMTVEYMLGTIRAQRADLRSAMDAFERVLRDRSDESIHIAWMAYGARGVLRALRSDVAGAKADLAAASAGQPKVASGEPTVALFRALVATIEAHLRFDATTQQGKEAAREKARLAIEGSRDYFANPAIWSTRVWARTMLDQLGVPIADAGAPRLDVESECRWFALGGERRVDLRGRRVLRKLLRALVAQHQAAPGTPLGPENLFKVGWPDTEIDNLNRLYVAMSSLRKLGLHDTLESYEGGYRLRTELDVRVKRPR